MVLILSMGETAVTRFKDMIRHAGQCLQNTSARNKNDVFNIFRSSFTAKHSNKKQLPFYPIKENIYENIDYEAFSLP